MALKLAFLEHQNKQVAAKCLKNIRFDRLQKALLIKQKV